MESLSLQPFLQSLHKEQWQEVRLGEVAKQIVSGGTPKSTQAEYYNGNIPWLNTKEVKNCRIYATERQITELGLCNSSARWIDKNSVIVAMYGATAGKVAINKIPLTTNQACCNISVDSEKANYNFIYYTLLDSFDRLDQMTSGAAQQNLNVGLISNFTFLLPPLTIQQKIAEILSSFDDKIDLLHRQNKTLESLALTLFRHYFIDNPKRDEWELGKLGDFCKVKKGKSITQKSAIQGIYPVVAGGIEPAYYHNECNTQSPVVTISASGANAGFVNIYYCPIWSSDSSYIDKTITPYVYFFYLFLKHHQNILYDKQEGSAQPHIYPSHIMDLEIPHYPTKLTQNFEVEVEAYFEKISHNTKQIENLQAMRDVLLKAIFA
ncbi:restriction endonuclease subunit S [Helicobacter winghamensis]|uniref:restriction endonuclease subunit S n=1 Tax=Helicobacter winghamensis TaxID=157268 RepID=UPI0027984C3A